MRKSVPLLPAASLALALDGCQQSPFPTATPHRQRWRRVAFTSEGDGDYDIYVMNADSSDLRQLTDNPGTDGYAAQSPDGTRIAFHAYRGMTTWSIYIMDIDGSNQQRLTNNSAHDIQPAWLPWYPVRRG
jgi:tricorn protease-like protein